MTSRRFHFETPAQWHTCTFAQADAGVLRTRGGVQPFPAYAREATRLESSGAYAPAVTRGGEILWRDEPGCLLRLSACDDAPERMAAPDAIGKAHRLVANASGLWVISPGRDTVHRYEDDTLSRVLTVDLGDVTAIDIADGGSGRVLVLGVTDDTCKVWTIDASGHVVRAIVLRGCSDASAFVFLRRSKRLVVLGRHGEQRLSWFSLDTRDRDPSVPADERHPLVTRPVAALHLCFDAAVLGSDGQDRVFLAGQDGKAFGGTWWVLVLDADGTVLDALPIAPAEAPPTGVVAARGALFVAGARGLLRFDTAELVPEGAGELRAMVLTPLLSAPDREDRRRWLRIDAGASLPEGSTLEIAVAATSDKDVRDRLVRLAGGTKTTGSARITAMLNEPDVWRPATLFHGHAPTGAAQPDPLSAKLFDITDPYLWVLITLRAAPGTRLPTLATLDVLYPGRTLMEHMPAIYQREEERPDSFLRPLVGVLETTTQGLDARITHASGRLSPATAPAPWLDFVATWLGVPWDDAMSDEQKRRVLVDAPALARHRGTRTGLETLLDSLVPNAPGTPPRYRVTDPTADFGFARVGGASCPGSALPAMLGGRTRWNTALGSDAVLGRLRLPCPGAPDDGVRHLAGRIRVEIAATGEERQAMEPWLDAVLRDMVPLGVRLEVRWVPAQALGSHRLDGTVTLEGPPATQLGTSAVTGVARLPARGGRLSRSGPTLSARLR